MASNSASHVAAQIIQDYEHAIARAILLCISDLPFAFGQNRIIGILRGSKSSFIYEHDLYELEMYGVFSELPRSYLERVMQALLQAGLIAITSASQHWNLPVVEITDAGQTFLRRQSCPHVPFAQELADTEIIDLDASETVLFDTLRTLRLTIAHELSLPAYVICHDRMLREMAALKPASNEALLGIKGIGNHFVKKHGARFLHAIAQHDGNAPFAARSHSSIQTTGTRSHS